MRKQSTALTSVLILQMMESLSDLFSLSSQKKDVRSLQRTSRKKVRKLRLLSAISEGMQSTASRKPAKRKAFQRTRLKASRMMLKSLPISLSQRLTLRLMQNVKRYLLYSIYITYTNKGHVIRVPYLLIHGFTVHT